MAAFRKTRLAVVAGLFVFTGSFALPVSSAMANGSPGSSHRYSSSKSHDDSRQSNAASPSTQQAVSSTCKPHITSSRIKDNTSSRSTVVNGRCLDLIGPGVTGVTPKVQVAQLDGTFQDIPLFDGSQNPASDDFYVLVNANELEIVVHRPALSSVDTVGLFEVKLQRYHLENGRPQCDAGNHDEADSDHDSSSHFESDSHHASDSRHDSDSEHHSDSEHESEDSESDDGIEPQNILIPLSQGQITVPPV